MYWVCTIVHEMFHHVRNVHEYDFLRLSQSYAYSLSGQNFDTFKLGYSKYKK